MAGSRKGEIAESIHTAAWALIILFGIALAGWIIMRILNGGDPISEKLPRILACKQSIFSPDCLTAVFMG